MSGHRPQPRHTIIATVLLPFVIIAFLAACGSPHTTGDISAAIADGVIIGGERAVRSLELELEEVRRHDFVRNVNIRVSAGFAVTHDVRSPEPPDGWFTTAVDGPLGTRVQAGELLGQQFFYFTEAMEIALYRLDFQIEQFEAGFERERTYRTQAIRDTRAALAAGSGEAEVIRLRLRRQELQLERFLYNAGQTRRNFAQQREEMASYSENLYAPHDGVLTAIIRDRGVFTIADEDSLVFTVHISPEIIRYGTIHTIVNDYFTFEAAVISDALATQVRSPMMDHILRPADPDAFADMLQELGLSPFDLLGMNMAVEVSEILIPDALVLPARALRREDRDEYVLIYSEGRLLKRYVTRGFQHGGYVQILMGLEEGQVVALP